MRIENNNIYYRPPVQNQVAQSAGSDDLPPPPVPQNVEEGSLPQNYRETDFIWLRLYLNSQFPPRQEDPPPPQE